MAFPFIVTESDLTNALFHNVALASTGSATKADARAQAHDVEPIPAVEPLGHHAF